MAKTYIAVEIIIVGLSTCAVSSKCSYNEILHQRIERKVLRVEVRILTTRLVIIRLYIELNIESFNQYLCVVLVPRPQRIRKLT